MKIRIEAQFATTSFLGFSTYCEAYKCVYDDCRDVETVESVIKWVKKAFANKKVRDMVVTFSYAVSDYTYNDVCRICDHFDNEYDIYAWDEHGRTIRSDKVKGVTSKLIKSLYLECVDKQREYESKREAV